MPARAFYAFYSTFCLQLPYLSMERSLSDTELTTVYVASSQPEAQIVKGRLETEGIPVMLRYESLGLVFGLTTDGLGQVRVQVPSSLAQKATEILSAGEADDAKSVD
jgi:hypothetical protein